MNLVSLHVEEPHGDIRFIFGLVKLYLIKGVRFVVEQNRLGLAEGVPPDIGTAPCVVYGGIDEVLVVYPFAFVEGVGDLVGE